MTMTITTKLEGSSSSSGRRDGINNNNISSMTDDDDEDESFIWNAPKVELHAHLNGCIRESTLLELAKERSVTLNPHHFATTTTTTDSSLDDNDNHHHSSMYNVRPRSLQDCFDIFAEIPKCVNDLISLERITWEALEDFAKHHVVYLELRSTPKNNLLLINHNNNKNKNDTHQEEDQKIDNSKRRYCQVILETMKKFENQEQERYNNNNKNETATNDQKKAPQKHRLPMKCRFLVAIDRSGSIDDAMEHVELAISLRQDYGDRVVGVDLGGNPTKNHFDDFRPAFEKARAAGLKITLHCAEIPCNDEDNNPNTAASASAAYQEALNILQFGPDRLGHALLLPPSLQDILKEKKTPVESCPTSNVMTLELSDQYSGSLIEGLRHHHPQLRNWLLSDESNHPISIGTDDPGVFDTTPTKELVLLQRAFQLSNDTIVRILVDSMNHAFCNDETKYQIQNQMRQYFALQ